MKKKVLTIIALFIGMINIAQTNGFNYKALITDNGNVLNTQSVDLKFTILQSGTTSVYQETQSATTDANGILVVSIGEGTVQSGTFSTIDWSANTYFLKVEIDTGSGYTDFGTTEFKAVPYAKYADKAGNVFSGNWNDLNGVPSDINDGDDDTQLTDVQIAAMGYIKNANDADNDPTNEIELPATATNGQVLTWNGTAWVAQNAGSGADNWGSQVVTSNTSLSGDGTSGNPLAVDTSSTAFNGWDKDASDDFDGDFNHLTNVPAGLSDGDDDTHLTETQVDNYVANNGYLTSEVDGSTSNELQTISKNASNVVTLSNGGGSFTDDDTQLTETQVDVMVANNGYAKEINDLTDAKRAGTAYYIGHNAGDAVTSTNRYNVAVGYEALKTATTSDNTTALGYKALQASTTGNDNTGVGAMALYSNTTGNSNVAIGSDALTANTTGYYNVANGSSALYSNTTGYHNVANGYETLYSNTTGDYNVANGDHALYSNTTGYDNTALGDYAFSNGANFHNSTALGNEANITASNQVRLGDDDVTWIGGHSSWHNTSDGRFKRNVQETVPGLAFITKLRPVTYTWDLNALNKFHNITPKDGKHSVELAQERAQQEQVVHTGFIAQEVETAAKQTGFDFDGVHHPENDKDTYSIAYAEFVVPLVKATQEQQIIIEQQNQKISDLEHKLIEQQRILQMMYDRLMENKNK